MISKTQIVPIVPHEQGDETQDGIDNQKDPQILTFLGINGLW